MAINSNLLKRSDFLIKQINRLDKKRSEKIVKDIERHLKPGSKIIDIGSGSCNISDLLIKKSFDVIPVDVKDLSMVENIKPVIYDGASLPFKNNHFDVALVLFVLHHCKYPEKILSETVRVSRKIIIMEDIYDNELHKLLTYAFDSALNQEFINHPHSNKKDNDWKLLFKELGLDVTSAKYESWYSIMKHATYCLEKGKR